MSKKQAATALTVAEAIQNNRLRVNVTTGTAERRGKDKRSLWRTCQPERISAKGRNQRYIRISFCSTRALLHHVVWWAAGNQIPEGLTINHKDGNPENNRLDNLELMTFAQQTQHAITLGLYNPRAPKNWSLTAELVQEIRRRLQTERGVDIARALGVSTNIVSRINKGHTYTSVQP